MAHPDSTTAPMSPLGLDPDGLLYFGLALVVGAIIVGLYCWPKFDESTLQKNDDDLITQFLPRDLASPKEYSYGLLTYMVSMLAMLTALSVLGPPILQLFSITASTVAGATPVLVALAMVGLLPNVPVLKEIEIMVRRFAHARAFIPAAARATAERLTVAKFDFAQYRDADVLHSEEMRGVRPSDFCAPRGSIEYNWVRLCSLCYALRAREDEETEALDCRLLKSYRRDLDSVYDRRTNLEAQIAQLRDNPDGAGLKRELRLKIRDSLQKLYIFIGSSARLRTRNKSKVDQALRDFGFDLDPVRDEPKQSDVMIVGLAVMGGSVLLICYAATELGKLGLWQPSANFPVGAADPFIWAISGILAHGAAMFTADRIRSVMSTNDRWYDTASGVPKQRVANYIRVGVACMVVGYIVLLACNIALLGFHLPTLAVLGGALPYAFMPAVTGAFYASHLDAVELDCRPTWPFEILPQAALTSFMGVVASHVWISLGDPSGSSGTDFVILVGIMGFAVGASLAWYIPRNAVRQSYDPLRDARDNRVRSIKVLAAERFSDPQDAERWLQTAIPSLQNLSPVAAVAEARNYEEILRLMNGMSPARPDGAGQRVAA